MPNKTSYNQIANQWSSYRDTTSVSNLITGLVAKLDGGTVLDIGCGTGFPLIDFLTKRGFWVTGIDFSEEMIRIAQSHHFINTDLLVCDFFDFSSSEKFDAVIAWDSLFHFPKDKQQLIYPKVAHLLKPGGYFLFTHGNRDDEHTDTMFDQPFYYSSLSKDETLQHLAENGFLIEYAHENYTEGNNHRDFVVLAKKMI